MTAIIKDKFLQMVENLLSDKEPFKYLELDYTFSIASDMGPVNKQKRKNFYQKRRELLLKLAPNS